MCLKIVAIIKKITAVSVFKYVSSKLTKIYSLKVVSAKYYPVNVM